MLTSLSIKELTFTVISSFIMHLKIFEQFALIVNFITYIFFKARNENFAQFLVSAIDSQFKQSLSIAANYLSKISCSNFCDCAIISPQQYLSFPNWNPQIQYNSSLFHFALTLIKDVKSSSRLSYNPVHFRFLIMHKTQSAA